MILVQFRKRVWKKVWWGKDGKGIDPWAGRTVQDVVVGGGDEEAKGDVNNNANETERKSGSSIAMNVLNEEKLIERVRGSNTWIISSLATRWIGFSRKNMKNLLRIFLLANFLNILKTTSELVLPTTIDGPEGL